MGARGLVVLVGMLCLGAGAPDPVEMEVGGVLPMRGGGAAVALIDATRSKALPIAVSGTEALSIQLRLAKQHYPRPLTHDLMESIVRELGGGGHVAGRAREPRERAHAVAPGTYLTGA